MYPRFPSPVISPWGQNLLNSSDLDEYEKEINRIELVKAKEKKLKKRLLESTNTARHCLYNGDQDLFNQKMVEVESISDQIAEEYEKIRIANNAKEIFRDESLSAVMDNVIRLKALIEFLKTGKLISRTQFPFYSNEEYLSAVIVLVYDLSRYATGCATKRDVQSIIKARNLVEGLLAQLLKFNFRNGHLRRKYDGVKYVLKRIESVLHELSSTSNIQNTKKDGEEEKNEKSEENEIISVKEMQQLRNEMEKYDEEREKVIKKCREIQKDSKNAVYELHRHSVESSVQLLNRAKKAILELLPTIISFPSLRYGSFSDGIEEYSEAKLFHGWLTEKRILSRMELFEFINNDEFYGALSDFTGELGRFAVELATQRDTAALKQCLETDLVILNRLNGISVHQKLEKKLDAIKTSTDKVETLYYELSLKS